MSNVSCRFANIRFRKNGSPIERYGQFNFRRGIFSRSSVYMLCEETGHRKTR